jgi:hypothetical protein
MPPPRRLDVEIDVEDDEPDTIVDPPENRPTARDSGLNVWHQALSQMTMSQKSPPKKPVTAAVEPSPTPPGKSKRPGKK